MPKKLKTVNENVSTLLELVNNITTKTKDTLDTNNKTLNQIIEEMSTEIFT